MDIKEEAFRLDQINQQKHGRTYAARTIVLKCVDCATVVTRRAVALYTGHMYEQQVVYVCPDCRGDMSLMIDKDDEGGNTND